MDALALVTATCIFNNPILTCDTPTLKIHKSLGRFSTVSRTEAALLSAAGTVEERSKTVNFVTMSTHYHLLPLLPHCPIRPP